MFDIFYIKHPQRHTKRFFFCKLELTHFMLPVSFYTPENRKRSSKTSETIVIKWERDSLVFKNTQFP